MSDANLKGAHLRGADLSDAKLWGSDRRTNLTGADLEGAKVNSGQLAQAKTLEGATLPDGTVHE